ncbi:GntR family transcriptional regulator [Rubellimicrobium aerolatum]|uniref:GntR family transcriptional regulator n=1 Tax=Rubellimicrobium aerolatum TaxID=490979 RepID=A0ABW0SH53_9RHOB|nr:GntR family transcriptional regulator [Rubellimicrobium aerolatum]MBP1807510.1 DNA-binding GntR family transcriptional regulator [Rubellimicrobium aerolatum]
MSRIEHQSLTDRAYQELLRGLTSGRFAPMQPLVIRTLAETYGISATPIREALQRLVAERLLQVLPNRSIVVPQMTRSRFLEFLPIRCALEGLAAEMATPRCGPGDFARLNELIARISVTAENFDAAGYLALNREFHFTIYEKSGSTELMRLIQDLWLKVGPVFTGLFDTEHYRTHSNDEHRNILSAMERGDAARARSYLVQDLTYAADALSPRMQD